MEDQALGQFSDRGYFGHINIALRLLFGIAFCSSLKCFARGLQTPKNAERSTMDRKWSRILLSLVVLSVALTSSKLAFATPVAAVPEIDPSVAIPGLALAATGAVLILERIRRRRK
jgi:hypothetical protein